MNDEGVSENVSTEQLLSSEIDYLHQILVVHANK